MKFKIFIFAVLIACLSLITSTLSAVISDTKLIEAITQSDQTTASTAADNYVLPYPLANPIFKGTINGTAYEIEGPIDKVYAQLSEQYPDLNFTSTAAALNHTNTNTTLAARGKVMPMACFNRLTDFSTADWFTTQRGVYKLQHVSPGVTHIPARRCVMIYCGLYRPWWSSQILVCNDNNYAIEPNTAYLGSYAFDLLWQCRAPVGGEYVTQGQLFDTDRYNVIVRGERTRMGAARVFCPWDLMP